MQGSLRFSEGTASIYPKLATICPLPLPIGWGIRKVQPSWTTYHISPLEPVILPQACADQLLWVRSQTELCNKPAAQSSGTPICPFQEPSCLGSVTNLPLLKVSRDMNIHFKDINTHAFTHRIACKGISSHLPYHGEEWRGHKVC